MIKKNKKNNKNQKGGNDGIVKIKKNDQEYNLVCPASLNRDYKEKSITNVIELLAYLIKKNDPKFLQNYETNSTDSDTKYSISSIVKKITVPEKVKSIFDKFTKQFYSGDQIYKIIKTVYEPEQKTQVDNGSSLKKSLQSQIQGFKFKKKPDQSSNNTSENKNGNRIVPETPLQQYISKFQSNPAMIKKNTEFVNQNKVSVVEQDVTDDEW